ncbi:MAG: phenylacetate--CoA ligase family protein, partial [Candidatus Hodarchaeota archaeon]
YANVPHYKKKFDEINFRPSDLRSIKDLAQLPILTKVELRENSPELKATDRKYKYSIDSTSGSSGPCTLIHTDRVASAYQHASVIRGYKWHDVTLGERIVRFWGVQLDKKRIITDKTKDALLNRITFSTHSLSGDSMKNYYRKMTKFKPSVFYGFASALYRFTSFIEEEKLSISDIPLKLIVSTGEALHEFQKNKMKNLFGCEISNEYGCAEFGPIAYSCPNGSLHMMAENVFVEVVKDECPANFGESGELVITNLHNKCMPLIRYKLGDTAYILETECICGRKLPIIGKIFGRTLDSIKTPEGNVVHGIFFDYIPKYFEKEIKQFQIIQGNPENLKINIVKGSAFNEHTVEKFEKKLRKVLGKRMKLAFIIKEQIPPDNTGKYRLVISNIR